MLKFQTKAFSFRSGGLLVAIVLLGFVLPQQSSVSQDNPSESKPRDSGLQSSPLENHGDEPKSNDSPVVAPWEERRIDNDLPDLREVIPRDLLVNLDEGEIENLANPGEIEPENSTLLKIMFRVSRFSQYDTRMFVKRTESISPTEIGTSPGIHRLNMFPIKGRATKIRGIKLPQRVAELYQLDDKSGDERDFEKYFQVDVILQPGNVAATVCTIEVPNQWLSEKELDEPFSTSGMFLKLNNELDEPARLLFAAHRLEWFPERRMDRIEDGVGGGPYLLSALGFDASLLDDARKRNRKSINQVDADCFYRMLSAVNAVHRSEKLQEVFATESFPVFDLVELMNNPSPHHGELFLVDADIRRITRVEVDNDLYRDFFQLDHYFQLDGFVDTDVIIKDPNLEKEGLPGYGKRYPVSICVPALPNGMDAGEKRVYKIRLPAFYFKTWTFKSQLSREHDPRLRHVAPLMIGLEPSVQSSEAKSSPIPFVVVTTLCIALFGFIWYGYWRQSRMGKESRRTRFQIGRPDLNVGDQIVDPNKMEVPSPESEFPKLGD